MKSKILSAIASGTFFRTIYQEWLGGDDQRKVLASVITNLHADQSLDLVSEFMDLKKVDNQEYDFFSTRRIFEEILPKIDAPVLLVMQCVLHLVEEAGSDMAAGRTFESYIAYCEVDVSRSKEALKLIGEKHDLLNDLLTPTIVAGSRVDLEHFLRKAITFADHKEQKLRANALFSLGRIQFDENNQCIEEALSRLEASSKKEDDDHLLGCVVKSTFSLISSNGSLRDRGLSAIKVAMNAGAELSIHALSEVFAYQFDWATETELDAVLSHLLSVDPTHTATLYNIDVGLRRTLAAGNSARAIEFLEKVLLGNAGALSIDLFGNLARELYKNEDHLLDGLMTRWFLKAERVLCEAVVKIVELGHQDKLKLEAAKGEFSDDVPAHTCFLARKAAGYLFFKPVTAASIILSMSSDTLPDETLTLLSDTLFDPLMINYPGLVKEFLSTVSKDSPQSRLDLISEVNARYNSYMDGLRSTGTIQEFHPPLTDQEVHHRRFSEQMAESMKEAEQNSQFLSIFPKSVILYGRSSIVYVHGFNDTKERKEIQMQSHSVEMEFPRAHTFDPFGLDYALRVLKVEKMRK